MCGFCHSFYFISDFPMNAMYLCTCVYIVSSVCVCVCVLCVCVGVYVHGWVRACGCCEPSDKE